MRGLRHAIPQNLKDSLDRSPLFQWFVIGLIVFLGVVLVAKGVNGLKNKRITGKYGRVYEGATAQVISLLWIAVGALVAGASLLIQIIRVAP